MSFCRTCSKELAGIEILRGFCSTCVDADPTRGSSARKPREPIIITTEAASDLPIDKRLDVITAECVLGMNIFKDVGSALRDVFGGRNQAFQDQLRLARKTVLDELRAEAQQLGAQAVVGISLNYSEISGGGKSMMFLVASGTAVTLR